MTALPLADHSLDAAMTVNTVYFVNDLGAVCMELARVLRPGGRLVIGIGDSDFMARLPFTRYGFNLRPAAVVVAALSKSGFTSVEVHEISGTALPHRLLVATRITPGTAGRSGGPSS